MVRIRAIEAAGFLESKRSCACKSRIAHGRALSLRTAVSGNPIFGLEIRDDPPESRRLRPSATHGCRICNRCEAARHASLKRFTRSVGRRTWASVLSRRTLVAIRRREGAPATPLIYSTHKYGVPGDVACKGAALMRGAARQSCDEGFPGTHRHRRRDEDSNELRDS
ncbi:hypothetical protein BRPE64_ACDS21530 [Caballeronia insecticola]|uniref:Uncharacterized protein n=1 Tax=Caballeronia insecticola TaxID=758793 RepID=R4WZL3_9BURK|nr:hypothetical protein BRPE64_ACDS21530 [Caballeronia insecticola]